MKIRSNAFMSENGILTSGIILSVAGIISHNRIIWALSSLLLTGAFIYRKINLRSEPPVSSENSMTETKTALSETPAGTTESTPETATPDFCSKIQDIISMFPVFAEQLRSVITYTDDAAGELSEAFMSISRQAKKQMQEVSVIFETLSARKTNDSSLSSTEESLEKIRENFSHMTDFLDSLFNNFTVITQHLDTVNRFADKISKIGGTTGILALNASIEAASAGEAGNGFKVIAAEVKNLAQDSNEAIAEITGITSELSSKIDDVLNDIQAARAQTGNLVTQTDQLFSTTITSLHNLIESTTEQVETLSQEATGLSRDIGRAVVSIQFQDITRQRLEHVIDPLNSVGEEIQKRLENSANSTEKSDTDSDEQTEKSSLMNLYTMESEREVLRKVTKTLN